MNDILNSSAYHVIRNLVLLLLQYLLLLGSNGLFELHVLLHLLLLVGKDGMLTGR